MLLAVDHQHRRARDDEEQLFLVAPGFVVLGDRLPRRDLNQVYPERPASERAPHQRPVTCPFNLAAVHNRVAIAYRLVSPTFHPNRELSALGRYGSAGPGSWTALDRRSH